MMLYILNFPPSSLPHMSMLGSVEHVHVVIPPLMWRQEVAGRPWVQADSWELGLHWTLAVIQHTWR